MTDPMLIRMAEPILTPSLDRFVLMPIVYHDAHEMFLKAVASFWTVNEVDLAQDRTDWTTLTQPERDFIAVVLAFFAGSDGIVNENLAANFATEVQVPEMRNFYAFQQGMEAIHSFMYALMLQTYIADPLERTRLFKAIETVPSVQCKADWSMRWMSPTAPFAARIIAFACVEGIFFSASFCAIYFFKKRGKMPGLTFSNELISRDEGLHRDFAVLVYSHLQHPLDQTTVHEIVASAVEVETRFVDDALKVDLIGMNARTMGQYVRFVADHLLVSLGYAKLYDVPNPYEWMELISLPGKTNFFEKRVGEYQKAGVMGDEASRQFATDIDF